MKIKRAGTSSHRGQSRIDIDSPTTEWSSSGEDLTLRKVGVRDFSTISKHSYCIEVTLSEFSQMLEAVSEASVKDPKYFEEELGSSLKAIIRL